MRTNGILMPIFSLSSKGGIGTFGKEAYQFVDFLSDAKQTWWQILPLNPTNYGDSPYQSFSSYAGNPYFIDPEMLIEDRLLEVYEFESFDFGSDPKKVDYSKLYQNRNKMLKIAFSRFKEDKGYKQFCLDNAFWLEDYAIFMAIKNANGDVSWEEWDDSLRFHEADAMEKAKKEHAENIKFYCFVQFMFAKQWKELKSYANKKGVKIIGDIPIYVAYDSADVWSDIKQFQLDKDLKPKAVAGCPPDVFCEDGQLWGNPLYDWKYMKTDGFGWWKRRIKYVLSLYDCVRIDHFRGFESYYSVPYGDKTAVNGKWNKGPDIAFFKAIEGELGKNLPIIAEDLGFLTPAVLKMLKKSGYPGMKVIQFAFDTEEESEYLPHNYDKNCVVYTGTHDNDTIIGWSNHSPEEEVAYAEKYLNAKRNDGFNWAMMKVAMMSVADTCILMMQDLIGLGSEGRINTPSTVGTNWTWRIDGSCINDWLAKIVAENTEVYGRSGKEIIK
ncbi:MAG: 4-alpha-glucanotransferase [Clostridia bacterium]|nr:4-alpha-glucanotransferase [Clostridia bacterium]